MSNNIDKNNETRCINIKIVPSIKYNIQDLHLPTKKSEQAAAYDLFLPSEVYLEPNEHWKIVGLGFHTEFCKGFEAVIFERSSIITNMKLRVFHGTIDSDYRGEWKLVISNIDTKPKLLPKHFRIAQVKFQPTWDQNYTIVNNLSQLTHTQRGEGGFGSTNV